MSHESYDRQIQDSLLSGGLEMGGKNLSIIQWVDTGGTMQQDRQYYKDYLSCLYRTSTNAGCRWF